MYDLVLKEGMWHEIAFSEGKRRRSFFAGDTGLIPYPGRLHKSLSNSLCATTSESPALRPGSRSYGAQALQLLKLKRPRARALQREKPLQ